jgi:hypothetical protein
MHGETVHLPTLEVNYGAWKSGDGGGDNRMCKKLNFQIKNNAPQKIK